MVENGKETIVNIDDEIPFDIPESWAWCRFEDLGFFMGGHTPSMKEEENWNGDIVWVSPKDMKSTIISNSILKISKKGAEKLEKIPINAILMVVRSGILRHSFPIAIAHVSCTINQDIKAFSSFLSESTLYIYNSLCSFESYIINNFTKEGTTVNSIEWDNLKRIPLPIPPLLEQKKIVAKIHESLALLKELDVNLTKTKQIILDIKSKLLDLAIRGKLLPQDKNDEPASELLKRIREEKESAQLTSKGKRKTAESYIFKGEDNLYYEKIGNETICIQEEIPFDIPENWVWCRLGDLCLLAFSGKSPTYVKQDNKHYVLGQRNNQMYGIDLNGVKYCSDDFWNNYPPEFYLKRNDILLNTLGTGTVGRVGIFNIDSNERYITDGHLFVFRNMFAETTYFMYYTLLCFRNFIEKEADGTTNQKFLKLNSVLRYLIPLPPLAEQKRIVDFITRANEQLDSMLNK